MNRKNGSLALYLKRQEGLMGDTHLDDIHQNRVDKHTFTIWVGGDPLHAGYQATENLEEPGVEHFMATRFEINLDYLIELNPRRPILVKVGTCGGFFEEGMQIFSAILFCPNPITILATKWARSMSSIFSLAADKFVIRPPHQYMFHRGVWGFEGLDQEAETAEEQRKRGNELVWRIYETRLKEEKGLYSKFCRLSKESIRKMLIQKTEKHVDVWLEAYEAKRWGFVDDVWDGNRKTLRAKTRNETRRENLISVITKPM